jgi:hypothetical protein
VTNIEPQWKMIVTNLPGKQRYTQILEIIKLNLSFNYSTL